MEPKSQKQAVRQLILQKRALLTAAERESYSARATRHLLGLDRLTASKTIMAFFPFRDEIDTRPFLAEAAACGQTILLPYTDQANKRIVPYVYTGVSDLRQGTYGIFEPDPEQARPLGDARIDAVIMPGTVFDCLGGRIGYGAGFYDRFLAGLSYRPFLIGFAFSLQRVDSVPMEPHDYRVDCLVTEEGVLHFS